VEVGNGVVVQHGSRLVPNYNHVSSASSMWTKVNSAGNSEFVIITFPDGDQVSIAGVVAKVKSKKGKYSLKDPPRMGVIIKLKQEPGLDGACARGNTVANNLQAFKVNGPIPSKVLEGQLSQSGVWSFEEDSHSRLVRSLLDSGRNATSAPKTYAQVRAECGAMLATADAACEDLPEQEVVEACVYDICVTGDEAFSRDAALIEALTVVQGDGIPVRKDDPGKCLDQHGLTYASLTHVSINNGTECEELLLLVGKIAGVEGAQLGADSNCQILFDPNKGTRSALEHQQVLMAARMWEPYDPQENGGTGGTEIVSRTSMEAGWQCWADV